MSTAMAVGQLAMQELSTGEMLLPVAVGIGLAAAAGLRVFLPMLVVSIAAREGWIPLSVGFEWLATTPAMLALATAALVEVVAYYLPGLDHLLDTLASPLAVVAGVLLSAAVMADLPPYVKWTIAIIAGGGVAGLTQTASVLTRAKSGLLSGGLANPLVSTVELIGGAGLALLALILPIVTVVLILLLAIWAARRLRRRPAAPPQSSPPALR